MFSIWLWWVSTNNARFGTVRFVSKSENNIVLVRILLKLSFQILVMKDRKQFRQLTCFQVNWWNAMFETGKSYCFINSAICFEVMTELLWVVKKIWIRFQLFFIPWLKWVSGRFCFNNHKNVLQVLTIHCDNRYGSGSRQVWMWVFEKHFWIKKNDFLISLRFSRISLTFNDFYCEN